MYEMFNSKKYCRYRYRYPVYRKVQGRHRYRGPGIKCSALTKKKFRARQGSEGTGKSKEQNKFGGAQGVSAE
jgi:hypothetical protein